MVTATHLQQQNDQLAQLLSSDHSSNYSYGHAFSGASPTIPATSSPLAKVNINSNKGDSDRTQATIDRRANLSSKTPPGRVKFNSIENESLKESGGGGGGAGTSSEGRRSGSGSLGGSPSKKLKKSSSSSSKHHHHSSSSSSNHHHHHHRTTTTTTTTTMTSGSSTSLAAGQKPTDAAPSSASSAVLLSYEKGVNVGYNLFAKLRELYIELKAETSPQKQSVSRVVVIIQEAM